MTKPKPVVLCILDGWGYSPRREGNAIELGATPNWRRMLAEYPHSLLEASGEAVGLPAGQMGNSEVGHMNLGAGRVVMQLLGQIEKEVADGSLGRNPRLAAFVDKVKAAGGAIHIWGLVSDGGVHSHIGHIIALVKAVAQSGLAVWIHAVLDGRDTPPQSADRYVADLLAALKDFSNVRIATVAGRYYAMDRNKTWERTKLAYDAMVGDESAAKFSDPLAAINESYAKGVNDEFVAPMAARYYAGMEDGDGLLLANFRADRVRQIAAALADPAFKEFERAWAVKFSALLGMAEYSAELNAFYGTLFPPVALNRIFGEVVARAGLSQLRIAETEKYAHVTFFFNGGEEKQFNGEERILIPSPAVA
ncbi:MAG: 2,3-bisphosphoglycerate-independent phosphoglycerate mutase, partial [Rickettsiales bacterium]|nr:2,3-bisphosphoglycerate-independent phosphoglycerate mutase [Rickettsiales bacterium]